MYTTNTIEGYHRQTRRLTKTKGVFTPDKALLKPLLQKGLSVDPVFYKSNLFVTQCPHQLLVEILSSTKCDVAKNPDPDN